MTDKYHPFAMDDAATPRKRGRMQTVALESVPAESHTGDCAARKGGYVCTLTPGHGGNIHVSHGKDAATIWPRT